MQKKRAPALNEKHKGEALLRGTTLFRLQLTLQTS